MVLRDPLIELKFIEKTCLIVRRREVVVEERSLKMRRDAIRMKTRKAVALKPNPSGGVSAYMPTMRSTLSGCPVEEGCSECWFVAKFSFVWPCRTTVMNLFWRFLRDKRNQRILGWIGGGLVFVATGLWQPSSISSYRKLPRRKLQSSRELRSLRPSTLRQTVVPSPSVGKF